MSAQKSFPENMTTYPGWQVHYTLLGNELEDTGMGLVDCGIAGIAEKEGPRSLNVERG